jgi:alpha-maltose-1-phosphate synthase
MHIGYVLLSPTFGMHQYTADLANRMAQAGHEVTLVTTAHYPGHRYLPAVKVHTPVVLHDTGFSPDGLRTWAVQRAIDVVLAQAPDVVHVTGPHLWNPLVLRALREAGIPTIHTLHDLDPHPGTAYGPLLHIWNRRVLRLSDHVMVHGTCYLQRLLDLGIAADRLTCTPLLHLFLGHTWLGELEHLAKDVAYEPWVLFFGRLEKYKGVDHLITAWAMTGDAAAEVNLVLAGPGKIEDLWAGALPARVEVRSGLVQDEMAVDLFRRCALLILPYLGATQSALIPAAYFFRKAVMAAPSGALHEYVENGKTGWLVEPEHPPSLARSLTAALSDVDRLARMGATGRRWYDERREMEERVLKEMYKRVAENG